jgi:hypothetical protein
MTAFPIPTELRLADTLLLWPFRGLFFAPVPIPIPIIALIMLPVAFTTPRAVAAVVLAAVAVAAATTAATVLGE